MRTGEQHGQNYARLAPAKDQLYRQHQSAHAPGKSQTASSAAPSSASGRANRFVQTSQVIPAPRRSSRTAYGTFASTHTAPAKSISQRRAASFKGSAPGASARDSSSRSQAPYSMLPLNFTGTSAASNSSSSRVSKLLSSVSFVTLSTAQPAQRHHRAGRAALLACAGGTKSSFRTCRRHVLRQPRQV